MLTHFCIFIFPLTYTASAAHLRSLCTTAMKNPQTGFRRLISALRFSRQGLVSAYRHEAAFRQETWAAAVLIPAAFVIGETGAEIAVLTTSVILVLIVEMLNSALEAVVDRFGSELHELSGRAKDMGSAAVLLSIIQLLMVWVLVLLY